MSDSKSPPIPSSSLSTLSDVEITEPTKSHTAPSLSPTSLSYFTEAEIIQPVRFDYEIEANYGLTSSYWTDVVDIYGNQSPPRSYLGSPVAKQLEARGRLTFDTIPMDKQPNTASCPKCGRPILQHAVRDHLKFCRMTKPALKLTSDNDKVSGNSTPNRKIAVMPRKPKKRKIDDGMHLP